MPRRSVTRFFIPLIDVLILLFCIFLLMPFVSGQPTPELTTDAKAAPDKPLPDNVKELQAAITEANKRIDRLEREKLAKLGDRLTVCVLEIDPRDGTLIYFEPDRHEIKNEADAIRVIMKQKALASKGGVVKDVYFLILYPRKKAPFPTTEQVDQMRAWFKDVPFAFDIPG
jgi:hypothetical protein